MFSQASVVLFTGGGGGTPLGRNPQADTPLGRHPPPPRRLLQRTVRILLECIHVWKAFNFVYKYLNILHFDSSGARIVTEKNSERSELQRDHQRDIQNLKKDHKREMDVSQVKLFLFFRFCVFSHDPCLSSLVCV